jgi:hypothetical protein
MVVRTIAILTTFIAAFSACSNLASAEANIMTCTLERAAGEYKGTCEVPCSVNALAIDIDGPNIKKACDLPPRIVQVTLHENGGNKWLGTMEGKFPEDPKRFELDMGNGSKPGVAKTPFGWFSLRNSQHETNAVRFLIAANNQLPPTADDVRIIERAKALLSDERTWNKQDDRTCPSNPQKWSLFCALEQSTSEVSGGVHYRQPALQMAREVLNEVGGSRLGKHRLMDYNNHPDTTLADIHGLLDTAQARLTARLGH